MRKIIAVTLLFIAALFILPTPDANADDPFVHDAAMFCRLLDQDHSPAGVLAAIQSPLEAGVDQEIAVSFMEYGLTNLCPEYIDDFNDAYDLYVGGAKKRLV